MPASTRPHRRSPLDVGGWLVMALALVVAVRRALADPLAAPDPTRANAVLNSGQDFRDAAYYPVKELLSGGNPYDPQVMFAHWPVRQEFDLYAPLHLVLHLPYAALPYKPALTIYSLFGIAYLVALGIVAARAADLRVRLPFTAGSLDPNLTAWFVAVAVVLAQFGKSAVYFGQINTLMGLGGVLVITQVGLSARGVSWSPTSWNWGNGASWAAVVGLALVWIKPQFGIPLTILLVARGFWRTAVAGTALAGLVSLPVVVALLLDSGGVGGFVDVIRRNLDYATGTAYGAVDSPSGARVDVAAVVFRLTGWIAPGAEAVVLVVVLGLVGWLIGRRRGAGQGGRRGLPFDVPEMMLVALGVLLSIVHQQSESLITVPAIVGVAAMLLRRERVPLPLLAAGLLLCVPAVHIYAVERLLIDNVGAKVDSLVEGVSLLVAFVVLALWMATRDDPDRPMGMAGTTDESYAGAR